MKKILSIIAISSFIISCKTDPKQDSSSSINGTWKLISGTLIEKGDTTITDYTKDKNAIKIINDTHFSFLNHDLNKGKDSTASFGAGGGKYTLIGDKYTEFLEYCNAREWENNKFEFTVTVKNDTLIQTGIEKIDSIGVNRLNIEKYVKVKI
ncbi:hypothetical protein LV89_00615 [Arcicella aurantiaca]|uniref:Lipocalin-like protein n=1 Tax=Arcicella aurantiaca TaxID=591202 RepID=A0A316EG36_9BACT|nr:hypothetical protein [Arcicella aurantiaca]PWK29061.1 hypothetical protein LV89_00615 [Arcicella aurantiaca]